MGKRAERILVFFDVGTPDPSTTRTSERLLEVLPARYHEVMDERMPGADFVDKGRRDLEDGQETLAALLVSIGAPRLRRAGLSIHRSFDQPEHRLYRMLASEDPDSAHSRYNALIRRLESYERAIECVS